MIQKIMGGSRYHHFQDYPLHPHNRQSKKRFPPDKKTEYQHVQTVSSYLPAQPAQYAKTILEYLTAQTAQTAKTILTVSSPIITTISQHQLETDAAPTFNIFKTSSVQYGWLLETSLIKNDWLIWRDRV